jgi:hypothetical protein
MGHDNAIIAGTEHPWGAGLEIDLPHFAAGSGSGNSAEMSRSTAQTAKPVSSRSRVCRPLPAARSSTRPPPLISGANRLTQAEAGAEDTLNSLFITISAYTWTARTGRCTTAD